jgi:hypothetical protein
MIHIFMFLMTTFYMIFSFYNITQITKLQNDINKLTIQMDNILNHLHLDNKEN